MEMPAALDSERDRQAAIIYTHSLIEGSMTFIKSHAEALRSHLPVYVGARRVEGIPLPEDRTYVVNDGTLAGTVREAAFRRFGRTPAIVRRLRAHRPAIVHAHFGPCGPAGLVLANALDVPLLVTFHGHDATIDDAESRKSFRGRELLRKKDDLIRSAGGFIAVSKFIRSKLIANGYPEDKIILHRNGIDVGCFAPSPGITRKPIVLFIGRFVEKKGVKFLIEAAARLQSEGVDFELVLIGAGPLEPDLRAAAEAARINCRFTGFLPTSEVREWISMASVVAIPSVTAANGDSEGLPTVLLEAQAMEAPVVATRHSGIPEGVVDGVTAELVEEADSSGLAIKLRSFIESPDKVRAYGRAGRQFVLEHFDIVNQVKGLEEIYASLEMRRRSSAAGVPLQAGV